MDSLKLSSKLDIYNVGDILTDKNKNKYLFIGYNKEVLWRLKDLRQLLGEQYSFQAFYRDEMEPKIMLSYLETLEDDFFERYIYYCCRDYRLFYPMTMNGDKFIYSSKHIGQDKLDSVVDHKEFNFTKAMIVENEHNRGILFSDSKEIMSLEDIKKYISDYGLKELHTNILKNKDSFMKYYDDFVFHFLQGCDKEEANLVYYRGNYLYGTVMYDTDFVVYNSSKDLVFLYASIIYYSYEYMIPLSKLKGAKFYRLCI